MNTQWKTTTGTYQATPVPHADDPVVPEGAGWALFSALAVDGMMIWTWVRSRQVPPQTPLVSADTR
jgi:hypothetical protein